MLITVALVGGFILIGLAIGVGKLEGTQQAAWNRVAAARRTISEHRRELDEREVAMDVRQEQLDRRERQLQYRERLQITHGHPLGHFASPDTDLV